MSSCGVSSLSFSFVPNVEGTVPDTVDKGKYPLGGKAKIQPRHQCLISAQAQCGGTVASPILAPLEEAPGRR